MSHTKIPNSAPITLRGLPRELLREMRREAKKQRRSLNRILLDRLCPQTDKPLEGACSELLKFAGTWNSARAADFEARVGEHRKIDSELWS